MSKYAHYLLLLMVLIVPTGCSTVDGASNGLNQDTQHATDLCKNGWDSLERVDAWMQKYMW